ncbi:MAG: hypothetical protein AABZ55_00340 [Bdellovibrionota bacterium]
MTRDKQKKIYPGLREKILINPRFQLRMVLYAAILATICVGFLYLADLFFFYKFEMAAKTLGLEKNYDFSVFVAQQRDLRMRVFSAVAFVDFSLILVAGIFISHRIAGPVFRICKALSQLGGNPGATAIVFRKKDFFPELSESFNKHRDNYQELANKGQKRAA